MGSVIELPPVGVVGKPEDRVDGKLKVTGAAKYSAEMPVTGALYAVLVTSTIANGAIAAMDVTGASAQVGVHTVLTPFNAPSVPNVPGAGAKPNPQARVLSILQDNKVYYQNQPIGLVIADSLEAAQYAASLVTVNYKSEKPVLDITKERASHGTGNAHEFSSEEARDAGRKGGEAGHSRQQNLGSDDDATSQGQQGGEAGRARQQGQGSDDASQAQQNQGSNDNDASRSQQDQGSGDTGRHTQGGSSEQHSQAGSQSHKNS